MRPPLKKKLVVRFDPEARREYLTGFSKRKRLRKAKAKMDKAKDEKKRKKKALIEKREELHKKLKRYGLGEEDITDSNSDSVPSLHDHHPNHVVVINTKPDFGLSLSAMVEEEPEILNSVTINSASTS